jgi:hypothetical protein
MLWRYTWCASCVSESKMEHSRSSWCLRELGSCRNRADHSLWLPKVYRGIRCFSRNSSPSIGIAVEYPDVGGQVRGHGVRGSTRPGHLPVAPDPARGVSGVHVCCLRFLRRRRLATLAAPRACGNLQDCASHHSSHRATAGRPECYRIIVIAGERLRLDGTPSTTLLAVGGILPNPHPRVGSLARTPDQTT